MSMLHSAPSTIPLARRIRLLYHDSEGDQGRGARCSESQSLAGEEGGPASPQARCLSEAQVPLGSCRGHLRTVGARPRPERSFLPAWAE